MQQIKELSGGVTKWQELKSEAGKISMESMKAASARLNNIIDVHLPVNLFRDMPRKVIDRYATQASAKEAFEFRRHPKPIQATLMCAYLVRRTANIIDQIVDLLLETVHKMSKRAEKKIDKNVEDVLNKAKGNMVKLYKIARATIDTPKGMVEEVVFPVASMEW